MGIFLDVFVGSSYSSCSVVCDRPTWSLNLEKEWCRCLVFGEGQSTAVLFLPSLLPDQVWDGVGTWSVQQYGVSVPKGVATYIWGRGLYSLVL